MYIVVQWQRQRTYALAVSKDDHFCFGLEQWPKVFLERMAKNLYSKLIVYPVFSFWYTYRKTSEVHVNCLN